jgi:hypothetical protein
MKCAIELSLNKRQEKETKEWKRRKARLKAELETVQVSVLKTQRIFNEWIRERDKDKPCISCGSALSGKYDAGHYYNANNHWNLRFDERNVHAQCVYCNRSLHGNLIEYRKGLINRIGAAELAAIDLIAHVTRKFTKDELKDIAEKYKVKK